MGLAQELTLAEAVKPLTAFRYISFDVVGHDDRFRERD